MLRKRPGKGEDDESLRESLLQHEERTDDDAGPASSSGAAGAAGAGASGVAGALRHQRALIVHAPYSVEAFISYVLQRWWALLKSVTDSVRALLGGWGGWGGGGGKLPPLQAERLSDLRARLAVPYDASLQAHQDALRALWALAFPGEPCGALKARRWRDMGWQGDDPATDFRGAGLFGLHNLLYLGASHPAAFRALLDKSAGVRADLEYPFAVAGLNLTFSVAEVVELHGVSGGAGGAGGAARSAGAPASTSASSSSQARAPRTAAGRAFAALLEQDAAAFEEVYVAAFEHLDRVWLARGASYMEFNSVLGDVKRELGAALGRRPASVAQLRASLGGV